ncbi:putative DsrC-like protein [Psychrobacter cryohalolentis K5]|uniref:Sulfurtransferase n=2 Tax=Psychrobacter cryohalolentis TaxID=330922 RepID=Q1QBK1_PSYCK|nr:TusE/DsrC/DsvC family sulfur relay protein [Psychrobacter cryohalolentis]ABE74952.1 putative DsrC-like protein [Psychrobacter cryohalolentis K5]ASE25160.1 TusE/DsrC/DsvC family sulfur relay protein [Psychrobacter cryohalolentis]
MSMSINSSTSSLTSINMALDDVALDQDGHLRDHTIWTPDIAQQLANTLDIVLDTERLAVLQQVRAFFVKFNHAPATRPLIKWLQQTLPDDDISNQKLQQLFNTGLVARHVNRLAGLPKPPNCL